MRTTIDVQSRGEKNVNYIDLFTPHCAYDARVFAFPSHAKVFEIAGRLCVWDAGPFIDYNLELRRNVHEFVNGSDFEFKSFFCCVIR